MPYQGVNDTSQPRRNCHGLVPSGRYRCAATDGRNCGVDHRNSRNAALHAKELNGRNPELQWTMQPSWLIPQYSTTDLKVRGWSTSLIKKLLGNPDRSQMGLDQQEGESARNLYDCYRVHDAEITPAFHRHIQQRIQNGQAFKPLHDDGNEQESARSDSPALQPLDEDENLEELGREYALEGLTRWAAGKLREDPDQPSTEARRWARDIANKKEHNNPDTVLEWQIDYLHGERSSASGVNPRSAAGAIRSAKVYRLIGEMYPELSKPCRAREREAEERAQTLAQAAEAVRQRNENQPERLYNLTNVMWV